MVRDVHDVGNFRNRVAMLTPDTTTSITVIRDGKSKKMDITIASLPEGRISANGSGLNLDKLGFAVQDIDADMAAKYGYAAAHGVMVTKVQSDSVAAMAGIKPGTLILEVNRQPVKNVQELQKYIGEEDGSVLLLIGDGRGSRFVVLKVN